MANYTEANVVKIKDDIRQASDELRRVNNERLEAEALVVIAHDNEREVRERIQLNWEDFNSKISLARSVKTNLEREGRELESQMVFNRAQASLMQTLLHDTIEKIQLATSVNPKSGLESFIFAIKATLRSFSDARKREEESLEVLKSEKTHLEQAIGDLELQAQGFAGKVAEKSELEAKIEKLRPQMIAMGNLIQEIEAKNANSDVLAARMSKEYREMRAEYEERVKK